MPEFWFRAQKTLRVWQNIWRYSRSDGWILKILCVRFLEQWGWWKVFSCTGCPWTGRVPVFWATKEDCLRMSAEPSAWVFVGVWELRRCLPCAASIFRKNWNRVKYVDCCAVSWFYWIKLVNLIASGGHSYLANCLLWIQISSGLK